MGLSKPMMDRLTLNDRRIDNMIKGTEDICTLDDLNCDIFL